MAVAAFILASIAAATWVGRYWLSARFGLYEDDYYWTVDAMSMGWGGVYQHMHLVMLTLNQNMARPILEALMVSLSMVGYKAGGMRGLYFLSFVILTLNAWLVYALAWRVSRRQMFSITAALAFALYPADTTQAYLMHSFGLQPSLTFLLTALNLYVRNRRRLSCVVAGACLLTYEVPYPVFLAAPLLIVPWDRTLIRKLVKHVAIVASVLAAVAGARMMIGEGRVSGLDPLSTLHHVATNVSMGPVTCLKQCLVRPYHGFTGSYGHYSWLLVFSFLGFFLLYDIGTGHDRSSGKPAERRKCFHLAAAGAIMLPLAYPLTLTVGATEIYGRATRVHIAAAVGASILLACALTLLTDLLTTWRLRVAAVGLISLVMTASLADGLVVQEDYRDAWQYQWALWSDVVRLCPDAGPNTVVLLDAGRIAATKEATVVGWNIMGVLPHLYRMPPDWKLPPILAQLSANWQFRVARGAPIGECINWKGLPAPYAKPYADANYILLRVEDGKLTRFEAAMVVGDRTLTFLESSEPVLPQLPKRPLYSELILKPGEKPADYIR